MERKAIEFGGIVRNMPDNTVKDGSMLELINLRPRDGALRPVGTKVRETSVPRDVRYIHHISASIKVYIGFLSGVTYLSAWVVTNGTPGAEVVLTGISSSNDLAFACLGNALMISDITAETAHLLVFSEDSGAYRIFNSRFLPEDTPNIIVRRLAVPADNVAAETFDVAFSVPLDDALLSQYVKMQKEKADKGYLSGKVLIRFAWELFDGTLVKHTLPDLVSTSEITTTSAIVGTLFSGDGGVTITTSFNAYKLQFQIPCLASWLINFKANYENIIKSLKIYVSRPKSPEIIDLDKNITPSNIKGGATMKLYKIVNELYDPAELKNYVPDPAEESYYFWREYKLSDLVSNTWIDITSDSGNPESVQDLTTRDQMPIDNYTHHQIMGKRLFAYNERIFLGNIKNNIYKGFTLEGWIYQPVPYDPAGGPGYNIGIEFDIVISGDTKLTVFTGWTPCYYYESSLPRKINFSLQSTYTSGEEQSYSYWGYPDARATTARVYVELDGVIRLVRTQQLVSYPLYNFAIAKGFCVNGEFSALGPVASLSTVKDTYYDTNRVQATEINNPFYYPAINSYRIGLGTILGMSSNAIALSTGQFGQFPVFVFCSDGIYTLNIGTGELLINTITPLSREVCNNPASITPIDGGTAFTTSKGLFVISGNQVIEISKTAEGARTGHLPSAAYAEIADCPGTNTIPSFLCSQDFDLYLTGAKIAWDYINKEILVSNPAYPYSWVYSLDNKLWFKITGSFAGFVYDYPSCYGFLSVGADYYRANISSEDFSDGIRVYMETRPIKFSGPDAFKKIHRLLVDGVINNTDRPVLVLLAGTTDLKEWRLLNNNRIFNAQDIMLLGRTYSCRQFILAVGASVFEDTYFNFFSADIEGRYDNKLR